MTENCGECFKDGHDILKRIVFWVIAAVVGGVGSFTTTSVIQAGTNATQTANIQALEKQTEKIDEFIDEQRDVNTEILKALNGMSLIIEKHIAISEVPNPTR